MCVYIYYIYITSCRKPRTVARPLSKLAHVFAGVQYCFIPDTPVESMMLWGVFLADNPALFPFFGEKYGTPKSIVFSSLFYPVSRQTQILGLGKHKTATEASPVQFDFMSKPLQQAHLESKPAPPKQRIYLVATISHPSRKVTQNAMDHADTGSRRKTPYPNIFQETYPCEQITGTPRSRRPQRNRRCTVQQNQAKMMPTHMVPQVQNDMNHTKTMLPTIPGRLWTNPCDLTERPSTTQNPCNPNLIGLHTSEHQNCKGTPFPRDFTQAHTT
jgi:hypothetical protein